MWLQSQSPLPARACGSATTTPLPSTRARRQILSGWIWGVVGGNFRREPGHHPWTRAQDPYRQAPILTGAPTWPGGPGSPGGPWGPCRAAFTRRGGVGQRGRSRGDTLSAPGMRRHPPLVTHHVQPRQPERPPLPLPPRLRPHTIPCLAEPGPTPDLLNFKGWLAESWL